MTKYISIDPGRSKCGLVYADFETKHIIQAVIIDSIRLVQNVKKLIEKEKNIKVIIGNGTSSKKHIDSLSFLGVKLIIAEEKNTTFRAKQRYFEIYPIQGFKRFLPREVFLYNTNLDAIAALIILEDYLNYKFTLRGYLKSKTWLKR